MEQYNPENIFQYCPKCGSSSFAKINEKKFRCNDCSFQYYFNANGAVVGIIRNKQGEVLFTRRAKEPGKGTLDLPGGFIDFDETAEEALIRESEEELGLTVCKTEYYCSIPNLYVYGGMLYRTIDLFYFCQVEALEITHDQSEVSEYEFRSIEDIRIEEIGLQSVQRVIAKLKE
jgi:NAD+ diphosphatase